MALDYSSDAVTNRRTRPPATPHSAGEVYVCPFDVTLDDAVAANDLIGLAPLPPYCVPVTIELMATDLDSGTAMLIDVGILNDDEDDLVATSNLIDGSDVCQAGGTARSDDYEGAYEPATWLAESDCPAEHEEKIVAAKVMTAATTAVAGAIRGSLLYRAAHNGI